MRPRSRRRGAGAHVLFARSVVLGLSSPVKDHSAVARSTSTFNEKSLFRLMPVSVCMHTNPLTNKPAFNTYAYGALPILALLVVSISVLVAENGSSVFFTTVGDI